MLTLAPPADWYGCLDKAGIKIKIRTQDLIIGLNVLNPAATVQSSVQARVQLCKKSALLIYHIYLCSSVCVSQKPISNGLPPTPKVHVSHSCPPAEEVQPPLLLFVPHVQVAPCVGRWVRVSPRSSTAALSRSTAPPPGSTLTPEVGGRSPCQISEAQKVDSTGCSQVRPLHLPAFFQTSI